MIPEPRYIPLSYEHSNPEKSVLQLSYALFPEWERSAGSSSGKVEFKQLMEGKTNMILKVINKIPGNSDTETDKEAVLLRVYGSGTDLLTDREREWKSHCLLSRFNLAPELVARFKNGLIYRFIPGSVCDSGDIGKERIWRGVARKLAEWHAVVPIDELPGNKSGARVYSVWDLARRWISALPASSQAESERKDTLGRELERLISELSDIQGLDSKSLVLGHCDLLSSNIIIQTPSEDKRDSDAETVDFIDYEYTLPCPAAFDISNHFSEWVGYECDYNLLPTRSTRRAFIREYVRSFRKHSKLQEQDAELEERKVEEDVQRLFRDVDRFRGVPGFFWAICAYLQALDPQTDFDYTAYGNSRLAEYWAWRAAEGPEGASVVSKEESLREWQWAREE